MGCIHSPSLPLSLACGQNPARQAAMAAGVPKEVPSSSVNMLCGSGLKAVVLASQAIRCGDATLVVAGGMESMTQVRGGKNGRLPIYRIV